MLRSFFIFIVVLHGLIHLLGFAKAYRLAELSQLTQEISRFAGALWLLTAILFIVAMGLLLLNVQAWWIPAAVAVVLSQVLVIMSWRDAKFGTIPNIVILIPIIMGFADALPSSYVNTYRAEVQKRLTAPSAIPLVTEQDIRHLPVPVQRYLRYVGAVGRPGVYNFRAVFAGEMKRTLEGDWMRISVRQYNFFDDRARLFYIESTLFGIPFDGLHKYVGDSATMQIKVASLVEVADAKGGKMTHGETVTMFNDMCLLAPSTLIDTPIHWETLDPLKVRATFTNRGQTISAVLSFNEKGELTDFMSHDRYLSEDGKTYASYPWSTPVGEYRDFGGRKVVAYAEAIWHMPEREYVYAKYDLKEMEYNCSEFK